MRAQLAKHSRAARMLSDALVAVELDAEPPFADFAVWEPCACCPTSRCARPEDGPLAMVRSRRLGRARD